MNYIMWVDRVWQAISGWDAATPQGIKQHGFAEDWVVNYFHLTDWGGQDAVTDAIASLVGLDLLHHNRPDDVYRPTKFGGHELHKTLSGRVSKGLAPELTPEQTAFLKELIRQSPLPTDRYVRLTWCEAGGDIFPALGWDRKDHARAARIAHALTVGGSALVVADDPSPQDIGVKPLYGAFLWARAQAAGL